MIDSMPWIILPNPGFGAIPYMGVGYIQNRDMRPRDVLAENIKKLMAATPALSTFPQITAAGGGSNGTLDRIRRKKTATGIDNLEPLADAYGLAPWQLLVPGLQVGPGTENRPLVESPGWPFESIPLGRFLALDDKQQAIVEGQLIAAIRDAETPRSHKMQTISLTSGPAAPRKSLTRR